MDNSNFYDMPITFQMALAHNPNAMYKFLKLENEKQDSIIEKTRNVGTIREIQQIVENIALN